MGVQTLGRSQFESLLVHVAPEWLLATVGRSRFESLLAYVAPDWLLAIKGRSQFKSSTFNKQVKVMENNFTIMPFDGKCQNLLI